MLFIALFRFQLFFQMMYLLIFFSLMMLGVSLLHVWMRGDRQHRHQKGAILIMKHFSISKEPVYNKYMFCSWTWVLFYRYEFKVAIYKIHVQLVNQISCISHLNSSSRMVRKLLNAMLIYFISSFVFVVNGLRVLHLAFMIKVGP
ncbi:hypothetical protein S83_071737 [Arachis hypogaea]